MRTRGSGIQTAIGTALRSRPTRVIAAAVVILTGCGSDTGGPDEPDRADIVVTASGPEMADVGSQLAHTVTIVNDGPDDAVDVAATYSVSGGEVVSASNDGTVVAGEVTWPAIATLTSGATRQFTVNLATDVESEITGIAAATAETADPTPANNDGSADASRASTSIAALADLAVSLDGPASGVAGSEVPIDVTMENLGPSVAEDVALTVDLPPGASFVSATDGGTFSDGTISWPAVASIDPDGSESRMAVVTVAPVGPAVMVAAATSATPDPSPQNNDGSAASSRTSTVVTFETLYTLDGEASGDEYGFLVEHLGDLDGDAVSDFVVTAPSYAGGAGKAYVYSGASGNELFTITGQAGERLGHGVDLAGDIDDDGVPDVVVSGPGTATVRIHSGADGSEIRVINGPADEFFGFAVGRANDVDGDGRDDVIVGAIHADGAGAGSASGSAYVYSGVDGSLILTLAPTVGNAAFGAAVSGPGDLDGDGFGDLLVGAPDTQGGGRVYVMSGADGSMLYPSIAPDGTGSRLAQFWLERPGDFNGDGIPDIFASDIENTAGGQNTGRAYIYSGADGSLVWQATGEGAGGQFGIGRGANADVDGDGIPEIFVAAWLNSEGGNQAGKAYLLAGADGSVLRTFTHTTAMDRLGYDAVGVGDLNGDGHPDYLLSGGLSVGPGKVLVVGGVAMN